MTVIFWVSLNPVTQSKRDDWRRILSRNATLSLFIHTQCQESQLMYPDMNEENDDWSPNKFALLLAIFNYAYMYIGQKEVKGFAIRGQEW